MSAKSLKTKSKRQADKLISSSICNKQPKKEKIEATNTEAFENINVDNVLSDIPYNTQTIKELFEFPINQDSSDIIEPAPSLSNLLKVLEERDRAQAQRDEKYSKLIFRLTEEIISLRAEIRLLRQSHIQTTTKLDILPKFPLETLEDFHDFEENLHSNEKMREALKLSFSNLGADDLPYFLRRAIRNVIGDDIAIHFSWRGSATKKSIQHHMLIKIIKDMSKQKFPAADEKQLNYILQQHFVHTNCRIQKRLKKFSNDT
ncbi:uncharacterized protein LOC119661950 [Teleopsis dalmanni]|uniref:uncharacterized protein LOC119661950 n=1 Tax=Teleopsis dalmanni TaxID=139649 RepID=UPI0018CE76DA|nr:uncharacterized protein LOC119661950 [Teleopsis dalmanni]